MVLVLILLILLLLLLLLLLWFLPPEARCHPRQSVDMFVLL
jgi:hypothetical protein